MYHWIRQHEVSRNSEEEQIDENGPASQQSSLSEQLKNSACEGSAADPPALRQTRAQKRRVLLFIAAEN